MTSVCHKKTIFCTLYIYNTFIFSSDISTWCGLAWVGWNLINLWWSMESCCFPCLLSACFWVHDGRRKVNTWRTQKFVFCCGVAYSSHTNRCGYRATRYDSASPWVFIGRHLAGLIQLLFQEETARPHKVLTRKYLILRSLKIIRSWWVFGIIQKHKYISLKRIFKCKWMKLILK